MPTKDLAVANWFISRGIVENKPLTQMQLHKLVYFAHMLSLTTLNKPLAGDEFEAWEYGPVLNELYSHTKSWGKSPITSVIHHARAPMDVIIPEVSDSALNAILEATWNGYAQFTAIQLSNLSHELNGPWDMAFKTQVRFAKISDEQIKQFYAPRVNEYLKQKMIA